MKHPPAFITTPCRALSNVADEGLLTEGFFWIPSLAGPTKLNVSSSSSWQ
jgi:YidC/Oxa1 family membrane protein insertase